MSGLSQRLELRQTQRLTITPQVRQSIEMLQLSNLEVTDFITAEMEQNPLLEWRERESGENALAGYANDGEGASLTAVPERLTGEIAPDATEDWQPEWREDSEHAVDFGGELQPWLRRHEGFNTDGRPQLDQTTTRPRTLREHLLEQLRVDLTNQGDRVIAVHLLELLDEAGYLCERLDGVARLHGLQCGPGRGRPGTPPTIRSSRNLRP